MATPKLRAAVYRARTPTLCRRPRLLPLPGEVLVRIGDSVHPDDVIAEALVPGEPRVVQVAGELGHEGDLSAFMVRRPGDVVRQGEALAIRKGLWRFGQRSCLSPVDGVVLSGPNRLGELVINPLPTKLELKAGMPGVVAEVVERRGAIIEVTASSVQGIAGVGEDVTGPIKAVAGWDEEIEPDLLGEEHQGAILVGGFIGRAALERARAVGARGVVVGGMPGQCFAKLRAQPLSVVVTDRFGGRSMDPVAFQVLAPCHDGLGVLLTGSANGWAAKGAADREGRVAPTSGEWPPEVIVPLGRSRPAAAPEVALGPGAHVRLAWGANAGRRGQVVSEPAGWRRLPSGAVARAFEIQMEDGSRAWTPRSNLELVD